MPVARVERRLAAIMATDIVGYSRLIEMDEARTLTAIRTLRSQVIDPLTADHRGRIVKLIGDGAIIEFGSVVDAVACAVAVQEGVTMHQREVPAESRIVHRIGINVGDVVVEDGDLLGDGVNIAARLEALAEPGGICISDGVQKQLTGKTHLVFEEVGERNLKNIAQPVRVWRWLGKADGKSPVQPLPLPHKPSIAVLPFDNLGGRQEETYFSDGITEDIITGLARFRSLFVIARNSSFAFRNRQMEMVEIGRQLGVSYLLEGSVRHVGDRICITAQLIEAESGMHIWAERYDRNIEGLFEVQDDVARTIVATLIGRIEDASLRKSLRKPPASLAAYDCLLRGLAHYRGWADDDNQKALEMFERALAFDPDYVLAHSYKIAVTLTIHGAAAAPTDVVDWAFETASHLLEQNPHESDLHRTLAIIWLYRRDFDAAEQHYRRSLEFNPNDADRIMGLGFILALRGKHEEALSFMDRATRLNPFHPTWYNVRRAIPLFSLKRYSEAARAMRGISRPGYWLRARLAACYGQLGLIAEAESQRAAILAEKPDFSVADYVRLDVLLEQADDRQLLIEGLMKAGLPK